MTVIIPTKPTSDKEEQGEGAVAFKLIRETDTVVIQIKDAEPVAVDRGEFLDAAGAIGGRGL